MFGHQRGFTTVPDIEQYKKMQWSFLCNIKMRWEYDGLANAFRNKGIYLYGKDNGTMRMNNPIFGILIAPHRDRNYGVDIYVPVDRKAEALRIYENKDALKLAAESEALEGEAHHRAFDEVVLAQRAERKSRKKRFLASAPA